MKPSFFSGLANLFLGICLTGLAAGQAPVLVASNPSVDSMALFANGDLTPVSAFFASTDRTTVQLDAPVVMPQMSADLALRTYENRSARQAMQLAAYSANTLIRAELPDTSQSGEFELQRHYAAPRTLEFKAINFSGDRFVKSNVIARLLQSEVDHLQKDDASLTALSSANYKFSYKGASDIAGRLVHVYQVKPRQKRAGLFKGRIFLDAHSGSLVRAEGSVVKSPSFFIKKIEFAQDYADIDSFTLPVHIHSEASTRLVGRAVVDIYQRDYQPVANTVQASVQSSATL